MIQYNPDGSGTITAPNGAVAMFPAGITPSDLAARALAFVSANPVAVDPPPPPVINVTVNSPDVNKITANVAQVFAYLPQLQVAVAAIPGAVAIPPAPVASAVAPTP